MTDAAESPVRLSPLEISATEVEDLKVVTAEGCEDDPSKEAEPSANTQQLGAITSFLLDWWFTTLIGFLVVSYWRGTWVLLDRWTCDQPGSAGLINGESFCFGGVDYRLHIRHKSAWITYVAGNGLLIVGIFMMGKGWWQPQGKRITPFKATLRVVIVYILGAATVNIWHGIWYFLDYFLLYDDAVASWWTSTCVGAAVCYILRAGASLLAPPAIFLIDGPCRLPPPITVTIITSYRSITQPASAVKKEADPLWLVAVDAAISFILLPWGVVGFWRGFWYLMDLYLWDLTASENDLHLSILYSALIGMGCLFITSEDFIQYIPNEIQNRPHATMLENQICTRLRTMIMAIGAVNFWRAVWYIWDEFMGETHAWSAALSHVLGVFGLLCLGCLSCITAPPSTLGVDAIAHPDCADEPLFHNVPVPAEVLYCCGIGRQQEAIGPEPSRPPMWEFTTSFVQQSASHLERYSRLFSSSTSRLSTRHMMKRNKSQFFRSR